MKSSTKWCLVEAARRFEMFGHSHGGDILRSWTGLGLMTTYKSAIKEGYMLPVFDSKADRCSHWFKLTPLGAAYVMGYIEGQKVKIDTVE
jgi:hypothetical protein